MNTPATVLDALSALAHDGYADDITALPGGHLRCRSCDETHLFDIALVDRVFRYEGESNPDDEAIVLGVRCPHCDAKGALVSGFGPSADPELLNRLILLDERFTTGT